MNPEGSSPLDGHLADLLAACDEAMARSGATAPAPLGPDAPPELRARLEEDLACLKLLHQLRPSHGSGAPPKAGADPDDPESDADGRYRLTRLQAIGGIGRVWLAHDDQLDREVALKELRPDRAPDPVLGMRFLREARITGRLQHPGIVPVYELGHGAADEGPGAADPQPFYTMRFVQGRTLTEAARSYHARRAAGEEEHLDRVALLNDFVSVCNTVAYAHARGVIHRDLKGQNVVLGDYGEVIVLDWGFAKDLSRPEEDDGASGFVPPPAEWPAPDVPGEATEVLSPPASAPSTQHPALKRSAATVQGQVLGTPSYMAPEQAEGRLDQVDHRTDVYGLGAILYEILTGGPPFPGDDVRDILRRVRTEPPRRPTELCPDAPPALAAICLRALAKDPAVRYASAADLGREVQRWLADEPAEAYPEPPAARLRRWARRRKPLVAGAAALVISAALAFVLGTILFGRERVQTAERHARELELGLYFQRIASAERELAAQNLSRASQLLEDCPGVLRGWEWHALRRLCLRDAPLLRGHTGAVSAVVFSPDGTGLASAGHDHTVRLWDVRSGRVRAILEGHRDSVVNLGYSPDGRHLASAGWDRTIRVWDVRTQREVLTLSGHTDRALAVAYTPDGRRLVSAGHDRVVRVWDARLGDEVFALRGHADSIYALALSPDGCRAASAAPDRTVRLWDLEAGRAIQTFANDSRFLTLAFRPDGRLLASAGPEKTVVAWDVATGRQVFTLRGHRDVVRIVAFSPDGRWLVSGDGDVTASDRGEIKVWDATTGAGRYTLRGHVDPIYGLAFTPDGRRLISASQDNTVKLWDLATGQEALTLRVHLDRPFQSSVALSPDGLRLASARTDRAIQLWDASPWRDEPPALELRTLRGHDARVFQVAAAADGRRLASVGDDGTIRIWDVADGRMLLTHRLGEGRAFAVAFSPDGATLATATSGVVLLLDSTSGMVRRRLLGHGRGPIKALAFRPDGRWLASGGWDGTVRLWDVAAGRAGRVLKGHPEPLLGVAFHPDGATVASCGYDQTVRVWDVASGTARHTLRGHTSHVFSVAFAPDGALLASSSNDGTVRLWDTATWEPARTLSGHGAGVWFVAFDPAGRRLASASSDWTVRLWDPSTGAPLRTLRGHTDRVPSVTFGPDGRWLASGSYDRTVTLWDVSGDDESR